MEARTAKDILRRAFAALTGHERRRLRAHAKARTPIFCGPRALDWSETDERGRLVRG